jgi:hypothetical protein
MLKRKVASLRSEGESCLDFILEPRKVREGQSGTSSLCSPVIMLSGKSSRDHLGQGTHYHWCSTTEEEAEQSVS